MPPLSGRVSRDAGPSQLARLCCLLLALVWGLACAGPGAARPLLGADAELVSLPPQQQQGELERLARAGVRSVRWHLDWNRVEPRPGEFRWQADEAAVQAARARGLEVVLVLGPCANWAVDPGRGVPSADRQFSVPRDLRVWRRYVREAVRRFRGRVGAWQIRDQPRVQRFRGTRTEYEALVRAACEEISREDPRARVVVPEPGWLDLGGIARLMASPLWPRYHVLAVHVDSARDSLSSLAVAWSVLSGELLRDQQAKAHSVWAVGAGASPTPEAWLQRYLLSWVFGAERCYVPADAVSEDWTNLPGPGACLSGYLALGPEIWAFSGEDEDGPFVLAWAVHEMRVSLGQLGQRCGPAAEGDRFVSLGPRPVVIRGIEVGSPGALPVTRQAVLAAGGGPEVWRSPLVWADWEMAHLPEFGLHHRRLRALPGGGAEDDERGGRACVRTRMRPPGDQGGEHPWLYFDVDDRWLYFAQGNTRVAVTVECEGSFLGPQKLGFNLLYDSVSGKRFTRWQWVDPGPGWKRYRFELDDVSFAGREGWDFCVNAKGSRQDLWVASVTVEKLPDEGSSSKLGGQLGREARGVMEHGGDIQAQRDRVENGDLRRVGH